MLTFHGLSRSESAVAALNAVLFVVRAFSGGELRFGSAPPNVKQFKEILELKRKIWKLPLGFFFFPH